MKQILFTVFLSIFLVILLPMFLSFGIRFVPDRFQPSLGVTQKVYDDVEVSQRFIASEDNLSTLGMSIKNPNLVNKKEIRLSIYDQDENLVRESVLSGMNIEDGKFVKFKFDPIYDSRNKEYRFVLSALSTQKHEALEVFLTSDNLPGVEKSYIDLEESEYSTSFVPFYKPKNFFEVGLNIYSQWIGKFLKDTAFAFGYLALVVSMTIFIIYTTLDRKRN